MAPFAGSNNSRFFATAQDGELLLFRHEQLQWKKAISHPDPSIISVGNQGSLFLRSSAGLHFIDPAGKEHPPLEYYTAERLALTSSRFGSIFGDAEGWEICIERVTPWSKLSEKLFSFLGPAQKEKGQTAHELIFFNVGSVTERIFKFASSSKMGSTFFWNVSRGFEYLVVGEPVKTLQGVHTRFSIISVPTKTVHYEFSVGTTAINQVLVNSDGTVLIDCSAGDTGLLWVVTLNGERHIITPPASYRTLHLGRREVILLVPGQPFLAVKSFDDRLKYHADMRPLEEMGIVYEFLFTSREDIDFVTRKSGQFKLLHTNVDQFETDAKRWGMLAEHQRSLREPKEDREGEVQKILKMKNIEEKTEALASTTRMIAGSRSAPQRTAEKIRQNLQQLDAKLFSDQITRERYASMKADLEKELARLAPAEPDPTKTRIIAISHELAAPAQPQQRVKPLQPQKPLSLPPSPPIEAPPERPAKPRETAAFAQSKPSAPPILSPLESQRRKLETLIDALEERFILGEISESSYVELRDKYRRKLQDIVS